MLPDSIRQIPLSDLRELVRVVSREAVSAYMLELGQKSKLISQRETCRILNLTFYKFEKDILQKGLLKPLHDNGGNSKKLYDMTEVLNLKSFLNI